MRHTISNIVSGQRGGWETVRGPTPADLTPAGPIRSLYLHIPFCFHKCHYCDFYSIVDSRDRMGAFTDRLIEELRAVAPWAEGAPLETLFVGGGTPTLLPPALWIRLLEALHEAFDMSAMIPGGRGEFSIECNPETVTPELTRTLADSGVNRLSIGAQSFDKAHLATLERWHDPQNVRKAIDLARAAGIERLSVDLIYATPGQTVASCVRDLKQAIALGVEHVSAYSLTYEPGTAMTARLGRGEFEPTDERTDAQMMRTSRDVLADAGFRRYEVSNFALPGAECRHNLAYWRQRPWLAAGPSASAHVAGHRWKNVPNLGTYLDQSFDGHPPVMDLEIPDARRALAERVMTGLRLCEGLDAAAILAACTAIAPELSCDVRTQLRRLRDEGLILPRSGRRVERWILTDPGMMQADRIAAGLMAIVDP